jgi:hypothetical protein
VIQGMNVSDYSQWLLHMFSALPLNTNHHSSFVWLDCERIIVLFSIDGNCMPLFFAGNRLFSVDVN